MEPKSWFWIFYVLTALALIFGVWTEPAIAGDRYYWRRWPVVLFIMVLIGILGYVVFGSAVKG